MSYKKNLTVICLALVVMLLTACHVFRAIAYLGPDINDKNIMPKAIISKSPQPLPFAIKPGTLSQMKMDYLARNLPNSHTDAFVIIQNDTIKYEYYSKKHDKSSLFLGFSVSKTFVATMLGIAIDEGYIKSTDEKIITYIPEFSKADASLQNVRIQQLLDMRSGIVVDEKSIGLNTHIARMYYGQSINKEVFKLKSAVAGNNFAYQNINTQILALIIERATGKKFQDYFRDKLWHKIGAEYDAQWIIDDHKNQSIKAYFGMIATAYDYAKLGRLYLHNGQANGTQVISSSWVNLCGDMDTMLKYAYKNHWWGNNRDYNFRSESIAKAYISRNHLITPIICIDSGRYCISLKGNSFLAEGMFEQYIYVHPAKNLIIVRFGDEIKTDRKAIDKIITTFGDEF